LDDNWKFTEIFHGKSEQEKRDIKERINVERAQERLEQEGYDSAKDTQAHIDRVKDFLKIIIKELELRAENHDLSKLGDAEKPTFDRVTPLLKHTSYGSDLYKEILGQMRPALSHHYQVNRHHPEHFSDGMSGMNLVDIVEMLCDWAAASERHVNGDLRESICINRERFRFDGNLEAIFENTASLLGK
jgi:hypothetical protein